MHSAADNTTTAVVIDAVFRGGGELPDGTPSGMLKQAADGPVRVMTEGLEKDVQADGKVHGGPDKAVHHYPAEHYAALAAAFPAARALLIAGALGENLSSRGLTEDNVRIGDVYAIGSVRLQVTQPRSPCWKIDARFEQRGMALVVRQRGITGWYYRVIEAGVLRAGEPLALIDRAADAPSIRAFHAAAVDPRPAAGVLEALLSARALPAAWRKRIGERIAWLKRHS